MGKFYGEVGYAETREVTPGVWKEEIVTRSYSGDVIKNTRRLQTSERLNDDLVINNLISIVADPFAYENFHSMRFVRWMGASWKVTNVEVERPRLILTIGGIYNE